ncbi:hypothetical protein ACFE04_021294 [Oxalis oulophora]
MRRPIQRSENNSNLWQANQFILLKASGDKNPKWLGSYETSFGRRSKKKNEQPEVGEGELKSRNKKEKEKVGGEEMIQLLLNIVQSLVKRGFDTLDPHHCPKSVVQGILSWLRKLDSAVRIQEIRPADANQNLVDMAKSVEGEGVTNVSAIPVQVTLTIDPEMEPFDDATNSDVLEVFCGKKRGHQARISCFLPSLYADEQNAVEMNESDEGLTKELFKAPVSESMENKLDELNYQQGSRREVKTNVAVQNEKTTKNSRECPKVKSCLVMTGKRQRKMTVHFQ